MPIQVSLSKYAYLDMHITLCLFQYAYPDMCISRYAYPDMFICRYANLVIQSHSNEGSSEHQCL